MKTGITTVNLNNTSGMMSKNISPEKRYTLKQDEDETIVDDAIARQREVLRNNPIRQSDDTVKIEKLSAPVPQPNKLAEVSECDINLDETLPLVESKKEEPNLNQP